MTGFQAAFARALFDGDADAAGPVRALVAQPAFAVYRNTVMKACVDALEANFPAVARLLGREWFRAAAAAYARAHPPLDGSLLAFGDGSFPAFLQDTPAAQLTYLPGIARLDELWRAAHGAADAPVLVPGALAGDAPEALAARLLQPHPASHWAWFDDQPVATIWSRNRNGEPGDAQPTWQGEGLLLTRVQGQVQWEQLPQAGCAFLDACADGACLGDAAEHVLDAHPQADLGALLQQLLRAGALRTGDDPFTGDAR
ncbi:MAG: DNA-binding domain-containing protein [Ramlibacter sp.]